MACASRVCVCARVIISAAAPSLCSAVVAVVRPMLFCRRRLGRINTRLRTDPFPSLHRDTSPPRRARHVVRRGPLDTRRDRQCPASSWSVTIREKPSARRLQHAEKSLAGTKLDRCHTRTHTHTHNRVRAALASSFEAVRSRTFRWLLVWRASARPSAAEPFCLTLYAIGAHAHRHLPVSGTRLFFTRQFSKS